jgi:hypothetical protein
MQVYAHIKRAESGIDDLESLSKRAIDGERHLFRRTGGRSPSPPKNNKVTDALKKVGRAVSRGWNRVVHPNRTTPVSNIQGPIFIFLSNNGTLSDSQSSQSSSGQGGRQASPRPVLAPLPGAGAARRPVARPAGAAPGRAGPPPGYGEATADPPPALTPTPPNSSPPSYHSGGSAGASGSHGTSSISDMARLANPTIAEAGPSGTQGRRDSDTTERGRRRSRSPGKGN